MNGEACKCDHHKGRWIVRAECPVPSPETAAAHHGNAAGESCASSTGYLKAADLEASPAEIIHQLAGLKLPLTNGWGIGVVVGAWKIEGKRVKLLLAWPNADNPNQLFNEDAASFLPPSDNVRMSDRPN